MAKSKSKKHSKVIIFGLPFILISVFVIGLYYLGVFKPAPTAYDDCVEEKGITLVLASNPAQYACTTKDGTTFIKSDDGSVRTEHGVSPVVPK